MPVNLHQSTRDLQEIAKSIVANPTIFKQIRRSGFMAGARRTVQSKESLASGAAQVAKKGVSVAIGFIPLPVLPALMDKAWEAFTTYLKARQRQSHIDAPVNLADKVKFELKTIGEDVAEWDGYRWKIQHAVEQYNKAVADVVKSMDTAPCDTWVRVWAKYYYLGSRVEKLSHSVGAMRAICDEIDVWLLKVEDDCAAAYQKADTVFKTDVEQLKKGQFHDSCSDQKCMFKQGQYTKQTTVPTSNAAKFFIKATSLVAGNLTDHMSTAVDKATEL